MSIAYVIKNTTSVAIFDETTNLWVQNHNHITAPKHMYSNIDVEICHENMISKLEHALLKQKFWFLNCHLNLC